jgi:hypothetical protein
MNDHQKDQLYQYHTHQDPHPHRSPLNKYNVSQLLSTSSASSSPSINVHYHPTPSANAVTPSSATSTVPIMSYSSVSSISDRSDQHISKGLPEQQLSPTTFANGQLAYLDAFLSHRQHHDSYQNHQYGTLRKSSSRSSIEGQSWVHDPTTNMSFSPSSYTSPSPFNRNKSHQTKEIIDQPFYMYENDPSYPPQDDYAVQESDKDDDDDGGGNFYYYHQHNNNTLYTPHELSHQLTKRHSYMSTKSAPMTYHDEFDPSEYLGANQIWEEERRLAMEKEWRERIMMNLEEEKRGARKGLMGTNGGGVGGKNRKKKLSLKKKTKKEPESGSEHDQTSDFLKLEQSQQPHPQQGFIGFLSSLFNQHQAKESEKEVRVFI